MFSPIWQYFRALGLKVPVFETPETHRARAVGENLLVSMYKEMDQALTIDYYPLPLNIFATLRKILL